MAEGTCSVEGCGKAGKLRRGWCGKHYQRFAKHGAPDGHDTPPRRPCTVDDCNAPVVSQDMCNKHYVRLKNTGTTDPRPRVEVTLEEQKARKRRYHATERAKIEIRQCILAECTHIPDGTKGMCASHARRLRKYGDPRAEHPKPIRVKKKTKPCAVDGCVDPAHSRGWCGKHLQRFYKFGDPLGLPEPAPLICVVDDCESQALARQYCSLHYARWHRCGDPRGASHGKWRRPATPAKILRYRAMKASTTVEDRSMMAAYREALKGDPCRYCGEISSHADHYFPVAKGGIHRWWALVPSCSTCNLRKHARCGTWFALRGGPARLTHAFPLVNQVV